MTRHAEYVMGTVVSIDVPDHTQPQLIQQTCDWLHEVDQMFSVFRTDSEISRLGCGQMSIDDASPAVRHVLTRCNELGLLTEGGFRHRNRTPARPLDPSGYVKGWSVERALLNLRIAGIERACIGAGGDIAGFVPEGDPPWKIGIRNPGDPSGVAAILEVAEGAVATSGEYERGRHIEHTQHIESRADSELDSSVASPLTSVSVVGPDLGTCDALATAVWADGASAGRSVPRWMCNFPGYDTVACTTDGRVVYSERLEPLIKAC